MMIERIEEINNQIEEALILMNHVKQQIEALHEELEDELESEYDDEE